MQKKNIAICISDKSSYSETFIKAHIDFLDSKIIYKSMLPYVDASIPSNEKKSIKKRLYSIYNSFVLFRKEMRMKRFLKNENVGVVLAEYGHIGVAVLETCRKNNIPLVVYFYGFEAYKFDVLKKFETSYKQLFEYSSDIIVVSMSMKQQLIKLGAKENKVHHIVCGANLSQFELSNVANSSPNLLYIGRFVEKKAPYLTILAFEKVLEKVPDAKLLMVGDGMLFDVCEKIAKSLHIQNNVVFLGVKKHSELSEIMRDTRAYVQHSIVPASGDSEGTPVAIVEAQASGLPVISTFHAGIQEVVVHNETGFLVEEGDVDSMATYMLKLLQDPFLAEKMGIAGRSRVEKNYSQSDSILKLKEIVLNAILKNENK